MSRPNKGLAKASGTAAGRAVGQGVPKPKPAPVVNWSAAQWQAVVPPALADTGLQASDQQVRQLAAYMAMLQQWNGTYNLTALRAPQDMLTHHLVDCLAVVTPLCLHLGLDASAAQATPPSCKVLDVGSGGGLPGIVLAILCPALSVTCVDTVGKKAAFIRQVGAELGLPNLRSEHARVEQLQGQFDLITSRAFASLVDFTAWTEHLLPPQGHWMAMKGRSPDDEMVALQGQVRVDRIEPLQVPGLEAERCLVWMRPRQTTGTP
jgi:16S rRNA (guanine527-N7)-methyltransferase